MLDVQDYSPREFATGWDASQSGYDIQWPSDITRVSGHEELLADLLQFEDDPLGFAYYAFPWGEKGTALEKFSGPEPWQVEILTQVRDGIIDVSEAIVRISIRSGHGIGKSALVSILILWAMLKEDTRGVVTANSERQLRTKTWAELGKWYNLYIGRDLFRLTATSLFPLDKDKLLTWRIDMIPWSEHNTTAFQGLHNQGKRILIIFDEASEIPKIIWDVASGALSDANTQIIWFAPGNPTEPSGHFYNIHQGGEFNPWICKAIDSRSVAFSNKKELARQISEEGIDSDFVRIRILGEFPSQGLNAFISRAVATEAQTREVAIISEEPVVLGVDVARFGKNKTVIYPRKGRDGRSRPYVSFLGNNTMQTVDEVLRMMALYHTSLVAVDGGGVGGGVIDRLRQLGVDVIEVQFGAKASPNLAQTNREKARYANKRAEIWGSMRDWLRGGAIPADPQLLEELCAPMYTIGGGEDVITLERKDAMEDRGAPSPDIADALAITFAIDTAFMTSNEWGHIGNEVPQIIDHNPLEGFRSFM